MSSPLHNALLQHSDDFKPVVPFSAGSETLLQMNFTATNTELTPELIADTDAFSAYINRQLVQYTYGIGGYNEHRTVYARSSVFDGEEEPRRLHLGIDIWGPAGIPIYAPLEGIVHSFAFNDNFGDYGATIILQHQLENITFYTLYGHLSLEDIDHLQEGNNIDAGTEFAHFGPPAENGHWPPHLHFQVIKNIDGYKGDYPGVCKFSEREKYLANCPDPDLILNMMQFAKS